MADTTLTSVPASTYAGDTLAWLISLADFPASDGWVLTYGFRCATATTSGTAINLVAAASGANHLVSAASTATAQWLPGTYKGVARVAKAGEAFTIWKGTLEVLANPIEAGDNTDTRTHSKRCLDNINIVLEGKATRDVLNTSIAGQSIGRMTFNDLLAAKAHFQDLVDREQAAEDAANGKGGSRNVLIRFGNA